MLNQEVDAVKIFITKHSAETFYRKTGKYIGNSADLAKKTGYITTIMEHIKYDETDIDIKNKFRKLVENCNDTFKNDIDSLFNYVYQCFVEKGVLEVDSSLGAFTYLDEKNSSLDKLLKMINDYMPLIDDEVKDSEQIDKLKAHDCLRSNEGWLICIKVMGWFSTKMISTDQLFSKDEYSTKDKLQQLLNLLNIDELKSIISEEINLGRKNAYDILELLNKKVSKSIYGIDPEKEQPSRLSSVSNLRPSTSDGGEYPSNISNISEHNWHKPEEEYKKLYPPSERDE